MCKMCPIAYLNTQLATRNGSEVARGRVSPNLLWIAIHAHDRDEQKGSRASELPLYSSFQ